jgi:hypothetical protein
VHAEGERVILTRTTTGAGGVPNAQAGERQEIELTSPMPVGDVTTKGELPMPVCALGEVIGLGADEINAELSAEPPAPGTSPLDEGLRSLDAAWDDAGIEPRAEEGGEL